MIRKVLIYGMICVVVAVGSVAYLAGLTPGEFLGREQPVVKTTPPPPRPAFLAQDLEKLEEPFEAAITADLPSISQLQASRRWVQELEPLIPDGTHVVLWKDAFEEYVDYRKRVVDAYRQGTRDPKAAHALAIAFLDSYSHAATWQRGDFKAIREQGDAAIAAGSTDPVVVAYHTRARHNLDELQPTDAYQTYRKLHDELGDGAYPPPILRMLLSAWISDLAQKVTLADAPGLLMRQKAFEEAAAFLAKESGGANPAVLLTLVQHSLRFDNTLPEHRRELYQACLAQPRIDPYIIHMLGGEYYLKLAWDFRGSGYAHTVTPEGWKKFGELMPRAARHFRRAWYLHPELPFAAQRMIMVATAGDDGSWTPEDWFHASLVAQFDYHEAYDSYMFVTMPRWRGSHQQIAKFAEACIATGRWDTTVPNEATTAIRLISMDSDLHEFVGRNPAAEQIAVAYIDAFAAANERGEVKPEDFAGTLANMTATLVQAGNFQKARTGFDIGPESNDWWWGIERGVGYRYSKGLSYAMTGPAEKLVAPIHDFLTREAVEVPSVADVEDVQKRLEEAKGLDTNPRSETFYEIAGRMLEQQKSYAAGDWVDLTFDRYMTLWISRAARYDLIDSRTLRLTGTSQIPHFQMRPLTRFAPPYMVEAEIKVVSAVSGDPKPGIVIGASQLRTREQSAFPQLLAAGPRVMAYFEYRQQKGQPSAADYEVNPMPDDGFVHLGIRRYPGETQMFAMHGRIVADRNSEPVNDFIMFGDAEHFLGITGEAVFRNLRIRRAPPKVSSLDTESPGSLPTLQAGVDYYPECPEARKLLAAALGEQGKCTEALEHVAQAKAIYTHILDLHRIEGVARCGVGEFQAALEAFREEYRRFPHTSWPRVHEAWLLATAPDEKLRDGAKAQQLLATLKEQMASRADVWSFRMTEAAVAAENGNREDARELARQAEEMADTDYRRDIARRVRLTIDHDRPYRMSEAGEIPPPPAFLKPMPKQKPASDESGSSGQSAQ